MTFQNLIVNWIMNRKFEKILNSKSRTGFESVRQSPKGLQKWLLFCVGSTSATKITGILQEHFLILLMIGAYYGPELLN